MASHLAIYLDPAFDLFRPVVRVAQKAKSISRRAMPLDAELVAGVPAFRTAQRGGFPSIQITNRGFHASTSTYYYWESSDRIDSSGARWPYGSNPPFSEISDVVGVARS
jgi:hypothetical protein